MVVRAADQLQWDVGEPRLYGSAVVRGATAGSTGNGDDERPPGLHHLTARVYPPLLDYCVGTGTTGHQLYCRAACSCDTYATTVGSAPDYVASSAGNRRRVHDRDCATRLRAVTAAVSGGDVATSLYGVGAPPKRRRQRGADSAETTPSGRPQADVQQDTARSTPSTHPGSTADGVARPDTSFEGATSPPPANTSVSGNFGVPELVTDCSLATNLSNNGVQGPASRPLYGHSST